MEGELIEKNLLELAEEIRRAGFPENALVDLKRELDRAPNGFIYLSFEKGLDREGLRGTIYLEPEQLSGLYRFSHFDLDLGPDAEAPIRQNTFVRREGSGVTLVEAVNLMEGRSVFRDFGFDHISEACWVSLDPRYGVAGVYPEVYFDNSFRPETAIRDSPLAPYLSKPALEKLLGQLRRGDPAEVSIEVGGESRTVIVTADPREERLRLTGSRGESVDLPKLSLKQEERVELKHGVRRGR
jgi:hypothetical protein